MINLPERSGRPPPRARDFARPGGEVDVQRFLDEQERYLRRELEAVWSAIREINRGVPGDRGDFVRVTSEGPGLEVAVPHGMESRPDSYSVASQNGKGNLVPARDKLADDERVYFKVHANKGVAFRVRLYRAADGLGEDQDIDDPVGEE